MANHAPVIIVSSSSPGFEPSFVEAEAGTKIEMDASASYDPDADISVRWFHYKDIKVTQGWIDAGMYSVELVNLGREAAWSSDSSEASLSFKARRSTVLGQSLRRRQISTFPSVGERRRKFAMDNL